MEWMDRARRAGGLIWVAAGLVFQVVGMLGLGVRPGVVTLVLLAVVVVLAVATVSTRRLRLRRLLGWVAAAALAADFLGAVLDRFGVFGSPGAPGVSWGSWGVFVGYTAVLLGGLPERWAFFAALLATATEVTLAVLLATGWQRRWVGKAAAGLLTVYLVSMLITVGPGEVVRYAVPILEAARCSSRPPRPARGLW